MTETETEEFAQQIADQVESFLIALQAIAREADGGRAISLLLLEISPVLLAGARLGAQRELKPEGEYQRAVGPAQDLQEFPVRLGSKPAPCDTSRFLFQPSDQTTHRDG